MTHFEAFQQLLNDMDNDRDRYYKSFVEKYQCLSNEDCDVIDIQTLKIVKNKGSMKKLSNTSFGFVTNYEHCSEVKASIKILKKEVYAELNTEKCDEDTQSVSLDDDHSVLSDNDIQSTSFNEDDHSVLSDNDIQSTSFNEDYHSAISDNEVISVSSKEKKQIQQRCNTETKSLTYKGKENSSPSATILKDCCIRLAKLDTSSEDYFKGTSRDVFPEGRATFRCKNELIKLDKLDIKTDKYYSENVKSSKNACPGTVLQSKNGENKMNQNCASNSKNLLNVNSLKVNILYENFKKTSTEKNCPKIVKSMKYSETEITLHKKVSLKGNCISKDKSEVNAVKELKLVKNSYQIPDNKNFSIDTFSKESQTNLSNNNSILYNISSIKPLPCVSVPNKNKLSLKQSRSNNSLSKLLNGNMDIGEDFKPSKINLEFLKPKLGEHLNTLLLEGNIPFKHNNFGTISKSVSSFSSFNSKYRQDKYVSSSSFKIKRKGSVYTEESDKHIRTFTPERHINRLGFTCSEIKTLPCPNTSFKQKLKDKEIRRTKGVMFESLM